MVTRPLPRLIQTTVDTALTIAVHRWPSYLRDELAQEWAAELHVLAHQPASLASRAWRSLGFTVSLMFARGIEKPEPTTGRYPMRTLSRPILGLVFAPVLMALAIMASFLIGTLFEVTYLDTDSTSQGRFWFSQESGSPATTAVAVILGLLGFWLGRRAPLEFPQSTVNSVVTVVSLTAGGSITVILTAPVGSYFFGGLYDLELIALLIWAPLLTLSMVAADRLSGKWSTATVLVGGALAWGVSTLAVFWGVEIFRAPLPLLGRVLWIMGARSWRRR